jgi:hypothetical protein
VTPDDGTGHGGQRWPGGARRPVTFVGIVGGIQNEIQDEDIEEEIQCQSVGTASSAGINDNVCQSHSPVATSWLPPIPSDPNSCTLQLDISACDWWACDTDDAYRGAESEPNNNDKTCEHNSCAPQHAMGTNKSGVPLRKTAHAKKFSRAAQHRGATPHQMPTSPSYLFDRSADNKNAALRPPKPCQADGTALFEVPTSWHSFWGRKHSSHSGTISDIGVADFLGHVCNLLWSGPVVSQPDCWHIPGLILWERWPTQCDPCQNVGGIMVE